VMDRAISGLAVVEGIAMETTSREGRACAACRERV